MRNVSAMNRRRFFPVALATSILPTVPWFVPARALGRDLVLAPSERIVMGGLGIGRRGGYDLGILLTQPDVQFVAVCDARAVRRASVKRMTDNAYGNRDCRMYGDVHEFLSRGDIDAVLIATGERWHAAASVMTMKFGKDVYCEKPCSATIAESRMLATAAQCYGRVFQAGTQRRTVGNFVFAVELARSGRLGQLRTLHARTLPTSTTDSWLPSQPTPPKEEVDWDLWLGPAPWRPFHHRYLLGGWRNFSDFHGGGILEWGAHTVDLCQWANRADDSVPREFEPKGAQVVARYANGIELVMRDTGWGALGTCSVRFEGDEGWIETGDSGKIDAGPRSLQSDLPTFSQRGMVPTSHLRQFLNSVKSGSETASNAAVTAQSLIATHCAQIAWTLGRKVVFDPATEAFLGDEEANRMRRRAMRSPWCV